jgi:malonate-semialdehyde dehydrogenase (acetylating)/methylmalonate-semialdehyde dehydrogenase
VDQGAKLVVDGRGLKIQGYENGFFCRPVAVRQRHPEMDIYKQEIFGPVLTTVRAKDL